MPVPPSSAKISHRPRPLEGDATIPDSDHTIRRKDSSNLAAVLPTRSREERCRKCSLAMENRTLPDSSKAFNLAESFPSFKPSAEILQYRCPCSAFSTRAPKIRKPDTAAGTRTLSSFVSGVTFASLLATCRQESMSPGCKPCQVLLGNPPGTVV